MEKMLIFVFLWMIMKEKKKPPSLDSFSFKHIEKYNLDYTENEGFADLKALRNIDGKGYREFCTNFLQCMVFDEEWRHKSTRKPISKWIGASLEAFVVLAYVNGYQNWLQTFGKNLINGEEEDDISSALTRSITSRDVSTGGIVTSFCFTSDTRGSARYAGWSTDGVCFYNIML